MAKGAGTDGRLGPVNVVEGGKGAMLIGGGVEDAEGAGALDVEAAAMVVVVVAIGFCLVIGGNLISQLLL